MARILLAQHAGRNTFEAIDEQRQRRAGRVVHVMGLPVELAQLGCEVAPHVVHALLAAGAQLVGDHRSPVCGDEHRVVVQGVDDAAAPVHLRVGVSTRA